MRSRVKLILTNLSYVAILGVTLVGFQNCSQAPMSSAEGNSAALPIDKAPSVISPSEKTQALLELNQTTTAQLSEFVKGCVDANMAGSKDDVSCTMMKLDILQVQNLLAGLKGTSIRILDIATFSPEILEYIQKYDSGPNPVKVDSLDLERMQMLDSQTETIGYLGTLMNYCQQFRSLDCLKATTTARQAVNMSQNMLNNDVDLDIGAHG